MHVYVCMEYLYFLVNIYAVRTCMFVCLHGDCVYKCMCMCVTVGNMCNCMIVYVCWCKHMCVHKRVCECVQVNSPANNAK